MYFGQLCKTIIFCTYNCLYGYVCNSFTHLDTKMYVHFLCKISQTHTKNTDSSLATNSLFDLGLDFDCAILTPPLHWTHNDVQ